MENKFLTNDVVEWCGVRGVVLNNNVHYSDLPVECKFGDSAIRYFTKDGKYCDWHKEPSLKLIKRPKKKVKKYKVLYKKNDEFCVSPVWYTSEDEFIAYLPYKFIQLIKESEVEVEE